MPNAFCLFCRVSFQMDELPGPAPCAASIKLACTEVVETHSWELWGEQVGLGLHQVKELRWAVPHRDIKLL